MVRRGDSAGEALRELVLEDFDGDDAVQAHVTDLIDLAHARASMGTSICSDRVLFDQEVDRECSTAHSEAIGARPE